MVSSKLGYIALALLLQSTLSQAKVKGKWFDSIGIIMSENEDFLVTMAQPPFIELANNGTLATNYFGLSHVSEQNYVAILAGWLDANIYRGDATTVANLNVTYPTILDQLLAQGYTVKQYTESYPGNCYQADMYPDDPNTALYYKRHSPFNMISKWRNTSLCDTLIGTYDDFATDVANNNLPNYFWIIPNDLHNTHSADTFVDANPWTTTEGPKWLAAAKQADALFINTWDESRCDNQKYPCDNGKIDQLVATILWGPMVPKGQNSTKRWDHFSIARTVEENWGLTPLNSTGDGNATAFDFLLPNPSTNSTTTSGTPSAGSNSGSSPSASGASSTTKSSSAVVKATVSSAVIAMSLLSISAMFL
ncbi:phosphoesterase family-domain-containing protein [Umbelopsis sp. PMI_123]|nr:phosphoesterase family-domain-containing protein [Umbelopsis sp. PMI_123]